MLPLLLAGAAPATAMQVTVIHLDGVPQTGTLQSMTAETVRLLIDGNAVEIPTDDIGRLDFAPDATAVAGAPAANDSNENAITMVPRTGSTATKKPACTFHLADDGQLTGRLIERGRETIVARTTVADETRIPFTHLAAIAFHSATPAEGAERLFQAAFADRIPGKDVLITGGTEPSKSLRGTLTEIGPENAEFIYNDRPRRLGTDRIHAIVFATGPAAANDSNQPAEAANVVVQLAGGQQSDGAPAPDTADRLGGVLTGATADALRLAADFGQTLAIPIRAVRSVAFRNDRVVYLSDLTPVSQTVTGIVHEPWPPRTDRNVFNQPLTLDGRRYEKGLGVHAYCELTYALGGQYAAFAATIGIDDAARPSGNVEFKIQVDNKQAYTSGPITGQDQAQTIHVLVEGAETLTLIVDYAENADVADWANWAEARLIRPKPSD